MSKTIKKMLALVLSVLMLVSALPMSVSLAADEDYKYQRVAIGGKSYATITEYVGEDADVIIPDKLGGYTVTAIGEGAFGNNANITKVVISDKIESIGQMAFNKCSKLEEVVFGAGIKEIASSAFRNCSELKVITLGESIEKIDSLAFRNSAGLVVNYLGSAEEWQNVVIADNTFSADGYTVVYNYGYDCETKGHKEATFVEAKSQTCNTDGNNAYWYCGICEAKFSDEALTTPVTEVVLLANHKTLTETVEKAATCTEAGNYAYWYCQVCTTYFKDATAAEAFENADATVIAALTHDWTENFIDGEDGKHYQICQREGCAAKKEETAATHNWNDGEITADSTCTETGTKIYTCTVCGVTKTETIDVKAHNLSARAEKAATCLEDGYSKYWYCEDCKSCFADEEGKELLPNGRESISKTGHNFKEYAEVKATCTEKGNHAYKECLTCGKFFAADAATDSTEGKDSAAEFATNMLYHNWKSTPEVDKKATCEEDGSMSIHCTRCTDTKEVTVIAKREHALVDDSVAVEAGCITTGLMNVKCSNVETETHEACAYTTTSEIDAIGHSFYNKVDPSASTCKLPGNSGYKQCRNCNLYFADNAAAYAKNGVSDASGFALELLPHTPADAVEENRVEAKCEVAGSYDSVVYCSACDDEISRETIAIDALKHKWNSGKVTTEPTCTEKGIKTFTCSRCKGTKTEDIAENGHVEVENHIQEPTCTEPGKTGGVYCSVCAKYIVDAEEIPALGHDWEELEGHNPATCLDAGKNNLRCKREGCGATDTSVVEALGHEYPAEWDEVTVADCFNAGVKIKDCVRCGKDGRIQERTPALNHVGTGRYTQTENTVEGNCTTATTYDEVTYCAACGTEVGREAKTGNIVAEAHDFAESFTVDVKATCETEGSKSKHCSRCEVITDVTVIAKREHAFEDTTVATDATCLVDGVMNQACSNAATDEYEACTATTTRVIPATNHVGAGRYTREENIVTGNCTTKTTWNEATYCSACDTKLGSVPMVGEVVADAHDFATEFTVDAKASCTADGSKSKHCSRCDAKSEVTTIPKRTHAYVDDSVATPETCTTAGIMNQKCSNTETAEYEACAATTTRDIPATGHSFGETVPAKTATCVALGNEAYKYCGDCDKYFAADAAVDSAEGSKTVTTFFIAMDEDNHSIVEVSAKAPTCTETGWDAYEYCDREGCGYTTFDELDATGHDFGEWEFIGNGKHERVCENNNAHTEIADCADAATDDDCLCDACDELVRHHYTTATCAKAATCLVCGDVTGDVNPQVHTGAKYTEIENFVEGTCTTKAKWDLAEYCAGCDVELSRQAKEGAKDPDNHDWSDVKTDAATKKHYATCKRQGCNAKVEIDHEYDGSFVVSKEPTCTALGQKYAYCEYCKAFVYVDIAALGHKDVNKDNKCDKCGVELEPEKDEAEGDDNTNTDTEKKCTCNCHKSGIAKIFFNIILFFQKFFKLNKECACGAAHY